MFNTYRDRDNYDTRHGGAFDRGSADSYYGRGINPHYFVGATYNSEEVTEDKMTKEEIANYMAGYEWNEKFGDKKDWG
jgi:hypothetical protein